MLLGAGAIGMGFLTFQSLNLNRMRTSGTAEPGTTFMHPTVQSRVAKTLGYFGYGIGATGVMTYMMRNSAMAARLPWWGLLIAAVGTMGACHMVDYNQNYLLKCALFTAFIGIQSVTLVPLIQMTAAPILFDAALGTGLMMSGLATVAYMAPSEQFLMWGGALSMCCFGMMGVGVASMFFPSPALFNFWLYGGLALEGALVLYRTQKLIHSAKGEYQFDPINHAVGFYLDAINIFVRLVMILQNNKRK